MMKMKYIYSTAILAVTVFILSSFIVKTTEPAAVMQNETVSETVNWMSVEEALAAQKKKPKPIMIDVYTHWCGPCKMLDKNTFSDARVAKYLNENFYSVKFNAEGTDTVNFAGNTFTNPNYDPEQKVRNSVHQFTQFLGVGSYPTVFFMDKTAQGLGPLVGYRTPAQIEMFLHYFAEEKYLTITTQEQFEEYEKNFPITWN